MNIDKLKSDLQTKGYTQFNLKDFNEDYYQDNMSMVDQNGSLSKLSQYKKPIAFSEIGSKKIRKGNFDNNLYKEVLQYHQVSYILIWHSWPNNKMAIEENLNASSLINDGRFLPLGSAKY